jgi:hypothetical protein
VAEKPRHVVTNESRQTQQVSNAMRGEKLRTSAMAAARPTAVTSEIMPEPELSQNRLGACKNAAMRWGTAAESCAKKSARGARPVGPAKSCPSLRMPEKITT